MGVKVLNPMLIFSLRAWQQKEESPENLALKDSGD